MKREAVHSTKMKKLCRLLDATLYVAVGILELLWHLTAREAPRGDIGKLSNEDIALSLDYRDDADKLITTLIECHWLDESFEHRLIVHDWHIHSDDAVDSRLARAVLRYANGAMPRMAKLGKAEKAAISAQYSLAQRTTAPDGSRQHPTAPTGSLPVPVPVPVPAPGACAPNGAESVRDRSPAPAASFSSTHGKGELSLLDQAEMIATAVIDEIGVTTRWAREQLVKQAEIELQGTDSGKPVIVDDVRDGMIFQWKRFCKAKKQDMLKPTTSSMSAEKFFGEAIWKDSKLWGFKKGFNANGINL